MKKHRQKTPKKPPTRHKGQKPKFAPENFLRNARLRREKSLQATFGRTMPENKKHRQNNIKKHQLDTKAKNRSALLKIFPQRAPDKKKIPDCFREKSIHIIKKT